jgi:glutaredoxin
MGKSGVVFYYKPGCPFAAKLRAKLTLSRVPHFSVDFHETEDARDQVRRVNDATRSPRRFVSVTNG